MFIIVVRGLVMEFPGNAQGFRGKLVLFFSLLSMVPWCRLASGQHLMIEDKQLFSRLYIGLTEDKTREV